MNIKEAKAEITHTIRAYTRKDDRGRYLMPALRQRPILLMGPPGIGKTAIMAQIARECGLGLVSYTITHHTRQSAIGLPVVVKKCYAGKEYSITEYTMSEIIASVYDCMEQSGCREGILFIDEINCVSETLAPTMLQFLQCKTFGTHAVPEGWVIIAAGNPPEYNKSAREFDIVTLDRVKKIDVTESLDAWKEYAYEQGLHPCILSYLNLQREHFYYVENTALEKHFVTARGWEDLSAILYQYEEMGVEAGEPLMSQYLQAPAIARDFADYYQLYRQYRQDYGIREILDGSMEEMTLGKRAQMLQKAPLDERITAANLILCGWNTYFHTWEEETAFLERLQEVLRSWIPPLQASPAESIEKALTEQLEQFRHSLQIRQEQGLLTCAQEELEERVLNTLREYRLAEKKQRPGDAQSAIRLLRMLFQKQADRHLALVTHTSQALERGFAFAEQAFADSQEMTLLVSDLTLNASAMKFIRRYGCEPYLKYSKILLLHQKQQDLLREIESIADYL